MLKTWSFKINNQDCNLYTWLDHVIVSILKTYQTLSYLLGFVILQCKLEGDSVFVRDLQSTFHLPRLLLVTEDGHSGVLLQGLLPLYFWSLLLLFSFRSHLLTFTAVKFNTCKIVQKHNKVKPFHNLDLHFHFTVQWTIISLLNSEAFVSNI